MALSTNQTSHYPHLSQDQQNLLVAALSSNKRTSHRDRFADSQDTYSSSTRSLDAAAGAAEDIFDSSLYSNYDSSELLGLDDPSSETIHLDPDMLPQIHGPLSGSSHSHSDDDLEAVEKRKSPTDDEDDTAEHKRHESDDKTLKKPGRKPVTSEPTTKRKAQNRAAQRAFRDRKEKHLKDLEQKIDDLEKASESANHENGVLRAQVDQLQSELSEYRKRTSAGSAISGISPPQPFVDFGLTTDFTFDFPRFGQVTSPSQGSAPASHSTSNASFTMSPTSLSSRLDTSALDFNASIMSQPQLSSEPNDQSFGIFDYIKSESPDHYGPLDTHETREFAEQPTHHSESTNSASFSGTSSGTSPRSAIAQQGAASSCGTSPEPVTTPKASTVTDATGFGAFSLSTLPSSTIKTAAIEPFSFDWLGNPSGGDFNPDLFGGYRESQDAFIGSGDLTGGLYGDSLHLPMMSSFAPALSLSEDDTTLLGQDSMIAPTTVEPTATINQPSDASSGLESTEQSRTDFTAHHIWKRIETCPKYQSGELDIDSLCSELATKARCTETGLAIPKEKFEAALWRLVGKKDKAKSIEEPLSEQTRE